VSRLFQYLHNATFRKKEYYVKKGENMYLQDEEKNGKRNTKQNK